MNKLIMMCGIPASGKSTYIKQFMDKEKDIYISRDEIRLSLLGEWDSYFSKEAAVWVEYKRQIDEALLKAERYVIADSTNITKSARAKMVAQIKNAKSIAVCWMDTPLTTAIKRNSKRTGRARVPAEAIIDMYKKFEIPSFEEKGIDNIYVYNETYGIIDMKRLEEG